MAIFWTSPFNSYPHGEARTLAGVARENSCGICKHRGHGRTDYVESTRQDPYDTTNPQGE
jgi:hypothetical protein